MELARKPHQRKTLKQGSEQCRDPYFCGGGERTWTLKVKLCVPMWGESPVYFQGITAKDGKLRPDGQNGRNYNF